MSEIQASVVMELRNKTGVSMMACKKALVEAGGDVTKATEILRKAGLEKADKKADRSTGEGAVAVSGRTAVSLRCETDFVARNEAFLTLLDTLVHKAEADGSAAAQAYFENERAALITKLGENITLGEVVTVASGDTVGSYVHSNRKLAAIVTLVGGNAEVARDIAMHVVANSPQVITPDEIADDLVAKEKEVWAEQLKKEGKPEAIVEKIMLGKEKKFREENALIKQPFVKDAEQTVESVLAAHGATATGFVRIAI